MASYSKGQLVIEIETGRVLYFKETCPNGLYELETKPKTISIFKYPDEIRPHTKQDTLEYIKNVKAT